MENNTKNNATNKVTNNTTKKSTKRKRSMTKKFAKRGLLVFLLFVLAFGFVATTLKIGTNGIEFTSKNIVDTYGKLDTNTQLVLEETIESKMKEEKTEIYFSFVYEDVNDQYLKEIGYNDESVLVYYNDATKKLSVKSDVLKDTIPSKELSSKEELADAVPTYLDEICDNLKTNTNNFYTGNKTLLLYSSFIVGFIILAFAILYLIYFIKDAKAYKSKKKSKLSKLKELFDEDELDEEDTEEENKDSTES